MNKKAPKWKDAERWIKSWKFYQPQPSFLLLARSSFFWRRQGSIVTGYLWNGFLFKARTGWKISNLAEKNCSPCNRRDSGHCRRRRHLCLVRLWDCWWFQGTPELNQWPLGACQLGRFVGNRLLNSLTTTMIALTPKCWSFGSNQEWEFNLPLQVYMKPMNTRESPMIFGYQYSAG